jgi:magnesium-transporting ATPase (P-type)
MLLGKGVLSNLTLLYFSLNVQSLRCIIEPAQSLPIRTGMSDTFPQLGHALAIRSDRTFLFKQGILTKKPLLLAVGGTCLLQLAVIYLPFFNDLFKTEALSLGELTACLGLSALVFHAVELEKWLRTKLFPLPRVSE